MTDLIQKIGLGGFINGELITFDYAEGERMKPYVCKILGRDFTYGFERKFVSSERYAHPEKYHDKKVHMIVFRLEPFYIYEFKRFMGPGEGEVEEGYIGLWANDFVLLEREEVESMCSTFRERAIRDAREKRPKKEIPQTVKVEAKKEEASKVVQVVPDKKEEQMTFNFAPDDIPF